MDESGLIRVRTLGTLSRRGFAAGLAGLGALAALRAGAARAASTVTFLGWQGYDEPLVYDGFTKQNGIELATTYIGNNDEIITKLTSGGMGTIDIVTPYMGYIPLLVAAGLIDPIDRAKVPNLAQVMPLFLNDKNINVDGTLYAVPFTWGSGPMMYDPAVFPTPPASWSDLLKPENKGRVGMMDDPLGNMMLAAINTGVEMPTRMTPEQLEKAIDFLVAVKRQSRVIAVSWGDMADALSRGDIAITYAGWETIKKFCADKGKRVEYTYPKEGTYAWLDNYCIAKEAPNADVAHALANEIVGTKAQVRLAENAIQAIVNKAAIDQLPPDIRQIYAYDDIENFGQKARFYAFPPIEEEAGLATYQQWLQAYERFKTA